MSLSLKWIRIGDQKSLDLIGCPWSAKTLRIWHHTGKHPELFHQPGGRKTMILLDVQELEKFILDK
jgi:hypothetical protein